VWMNLFDDAFFLGTVDIDFIARLEHLGFLS
jgi:hypothetical protein